MEEVNVSRVNPIHHNIKPILEFQVNASEKRLKINNTWTKVYLWARDFKSYNYRTHGSVFIVELLLYSDEVWRLLATDQPVLDQHA